MTNIHFDKEDREIVAIVRDILNKEKSKTTRKKLFEPHLHPRGIKEMADDKSIRIASAVIYLLDSLESGKSKDRLAALNALYNEVIFSAESFFKINTARVLIEVMKDLIRCQKNDLKALMLAHTFRTAASGKPKIIRSLLKEYHLLEMPEEKNQLTFDHHVHDANTKGRKSPTHLIMDAWIKGIKKITVIYYNYIQPEAARELLSAATIMQIDIRIGIELSTPFRGRYIQMVWVPRGFINTTEFLDFLKTERVHEFFSEGKKVSDYLGQHIFHTFNLFINTHLPKITSQFSITPPFIDYEEFIEFVGEGQVSLVHLAEYIHSKIYPVLEEKFEELREILLKNQSPEVISEIEKQIKDLNELDAETILEKYLSLEANPSIKNPFIKTSNPDSPTNLKLQPVDLLSKVNNLPCGTRITLNISDLSVFDVFELLYECKGMITDLEIYNHKDFMKGKTHFYNDIHELYEVINSDSIINLKRFIHYLIKKLEASNEEDIKRVEKFKHILYNMTEFKSFYHKNPIGMRIGSDSTGRTKKVLGMGFAIKETLPYRAQKEAARSHSFIPLNITPYLQVTHKALVERNIYRKCVNKLVARIPILRSLQKTRREWFINSKTSLAAPSNVINLGRLLRYTGNGFDPYEKEHSNRPLKFSWTYLNSSIKNHLKVIIGFIPAFLTFYLTKDWWILAYLGAPIWLGITGLRNILQSILGGGGIKRSPLLKWNDYVSWERVADSMLYTGFSVPLLDLIVKKWILNDIFLINTTTSPILLYTFMALANGVYLSSHNIVRGLPRGAVFGNFFRSILSIPIAVLFNMAIGSILGSLGITNIASHLQKWAAIISKAASDCVAGFIEGAADRYRNKRLRDSDYTLKLEQLFDSYARIELLFPEQDVLSMLKNPKEIIKTMKEDQSKLLKEVIYDALDLLYFWMYQPHAPTALRKSLLSMTVEEKEIFLRFQYVLKRQKRIVKLFAGGIIGKNFSKALAFYLDRSSEYLEAMEKMVYGNKKSSETSATDFKNI